MDIIGTFPAIQCKSHINKEFRWFTVAEWLGGLVWILNKLVWGPSGGTEAHSSVQENRKHKTQVSLYTTHNTIDIFTLLYDFYSREDKALFLM